MDIFAILVTAILVNNYIFSQFLGICSFIGVSQKIETAKGMGLAVTFVMCLASTMAYLVYRFILQRFEVEYLSTLAFILVIAALVQFVEIVIKKTQPGLYKALGIYLPLITTNCAVLAVAVTNMNKGYNLIESLVNGIGSALGYMLAIVLLAGIRERMEENTDIPEVFRGFPIILITAGIMAIAFLGFKGLGGL